MAETPKNPIVLDSFDKKHLQQVAALENKVAAIYAELCKEVGVIAELYGKNVDLEKVFRLGDYPQLNKKVDEIIGSLHDRLGSAIVDGVTAQWQLANEKNDDLVRKVFGKDLDGLTEDQLTRYFTSNDNALKAFLNRKDKGLGLSQKVWKYAKEAKVDIESTLELGIKTGQSASALARDLKQHLKEPDRLFRRVRDKEGKLHLSKAAQAYHPGQGVYRSSYKNALRLAVTEANMAYRASDYERVQNFDFVVGIEVRLSNNHTLNGKPFYDICDELKGKYPKDFKFRGWHPFCRCHSITILKTREELMEDNRRILAGEEPTEESVNSVTEMPGNFQKWVDNNKARILAADKRGTLPYFITDNPYTVNTALGQPLASVKVPLWYAHNAQVKEVQGKLKEIKAWSAEHPKSKKIVGLINDADAAISNGAVIEDILAKFEAANKEYKGKLWKAEYVAKKKAEAAKKPTALEIAKKRHESRTAEQISNIKTEWGKRTIRQLNQAIDDGLLPQEVFGKTGDMYMMLKVGDFTAFNKAVSPLQKAVTRHKVRTPETIKTIKDAWNKRLEEIAKDEQFLSALIPDVKAWKKQFSSKKLHEVYDAVEKKMAQINALPLDQQVKALNKEILYVSDATYLKPHTLYSTWEVSQTAYKAQLAIVENKLSISAIYDELEPINNWLKKHPKVKKLSGMVDEVEDLINSGADVSYIKAKMSAVNTEYKNKLYNEQYAAKLKAKGSGTFATPSSGGIVQFDESCFTKARKDAALWDTEEKAKAGGYKHGKLADDALFDPATTAWKEAIKREDAAKKLIDDYEKGLISKQQFEAELKAKNLRVYAYDSSGTTVYMTEREAIYDYTMHYCNVNEPLEERRYIGSQKRDRFEAKTNAITNIIDTCETPVDMWFQRGDSGLDAIFGRLEFAGVDVPYSIRSKASQFTDELVADLQQFVGKTMQEGGFMSMGSGKRKGFTEDFGSKNVIINIYAPKGTKAIYAEHFSYYGNGVCSANWDGHHAVIRNFSQEFETLAQRGTKMRITKIEKGNYRGNDIIYVDVEIVGQEIKDLSYVLDSNIGY